MRLRWDTPGSRKYHTGVDHGVLYLKQGDGYNLAYPWNGLTNITEKPTGAEPTPLYGDNIKYLNLLSLEDFEYSIEAYTYPDEFSKCDGSYEIGEGVHAHQQDREIFGLCYRSFIGNESNPRAGYVIRLIYNGTASVSERTYSSISDNVEPDTMTWDVSTVPVEIEGFAPSAWIEINSLKCDPEKLSAIEDILYGTATENPRLPMPNEIVEIFTGNVLYPEPDLFPEDSTSPQG